MDKLHRQIDEMRARLAENAQAEQTLLRALSDALNHVDQQLLKEVRQVTAEHEARRVAILGELQVLATRLCTFPAPREPVAAIDANAHAAPASGSPLKHAPGDWRLAASNIGDDLDDLYVNGAHHSH